MIPVLIIAVLALIIFNIWNLLTLNNLKKKSRSDDKELNDSKYYELKYKVEFLIAVFTMIVAITGFLGYNSLKDVKGEIKTELNEEIQAIDTKIKETDSTLKERDSINNENLNNTELTIKNRDKIVRELAIKTENISQNIKTFDSKIISQKIKFDSLDIKIDIINNKNIIKQNFYIINAIKFKETQDITYGKVYFKNLVTNLGDNLPNFKDPPLVVPVSLTNDIITIFNLTKDSFEFGLGGSFNKRTDSINFSLLIIEK